MFMASAASHAADWFVRELNYAKSKGKRIITVHLDDTPPPEGTAVEMGIFDTQKIFLSHVSDEQLAEAFRNSVLAPLPAPDPAKPEVAPASHAPVNELQLRFARIEAQLDRGEFSQVIQDIGRPEANPLFRKATIAERGQLYRYLLWAERELYWSEDLTEALMPPFSGRSYSQACRCGQQQALNQINQRLLDNIQAFLDMEVDLTDTYSYTAERPEQCGGDYAYLWECLLFRTDNLTPGPEGKTPSEIEALRRWYAAFEQVCPAWLLQGGQGWTGVRDAGRVLRYFEALETLAAQHNGQADYEKGMELYLNGQLEEAVAHLRRAADRSHSRALYELGLCHVNGEGVRCDAAEAVRLFRQAAELGLVEAQRELARCYKYGEGIRPDGAEAVRWYRRAADQGDMWAQYLTGECYDQGDGIDEDKLEAIKWFRRAADQEHTLAQYRLARFYDYGWGVPIDKVEAAKWSRRAAERNLPEAQNALGVAISFGEGVPKDAADGARWYRRAAENGFAYAQYNLAVCLDFGNGVDEDKAEAMDWYRRAAEQGDADAQYCYGIGLMRGIGAKKDEEEALRWLRLAANNGSGRAANFLTHYRRLHQ